MKSAIIFRGREPLAELMKLYLHAFDQDQVDRCYVRGRGRLEAPEAPDEHNALQRR